MRLNSFRLSGASIAALAVGLVSCSSPAHGPAPQVALDREIPVSALADGVLLSIFPRTRGYRLVEIPQHDVDVQLQIFTRDSPEPLTFDAPARRAAPERGCYFGDSRPLLLRVSTRDRVRASSRKVRVKVSVAPRHAPEQQSVLAAECLEAQGAFDHAVWSAERAHAQAAAYAKAAQLWATHSRVDRAATARLQQAWMITRRIADSAAAIDAGESARAAFHGIADAVGEAHAVLQLIVPRGVLAQTAAGGSGAPTPEASGAFQDALVALSDAIGVYEHANLGYFVAESHNSLGASYFFAGRQADAMRHLTEAAIRFRAQGELEGATRALANVNIVLNATGNYREAAAAFDRLMSSEDTAAADEPLADILDNSASTHSAAGDYDKALRQFLQAAQIHAETADDFGLARSLNGLAATYLRVGHARAALAYARQARTLWPASEQSTESDEVVSELILGNAHRQLGEQADARRAHERSLRLAPSGRLRVQALLELARDHLLAGDAGPALEHIAAAERIVKPDWGTLADQLRLERARTHLQAGNLRAAEVDFGAVRERFAAVGADALEIEVLHGLASTHFAQGRIDAAVQINSACLEQLEALRLATTNPEFRARLIATHRAAFQLRVDIVLARRAAARTDAERESLLMEAFAAADAASAGLVREMSALIPSAGAQRANGELQQLAAEIALRQHLLSSLERGGWLPANGAQLRLDLASLRTRFDTLAGQRSAPVAVARPEAISLTRVRADTAVFIFLRSTSHLHRYVITAGRLHELQPRSTADVEQAIARLSQSDAPRLLPSPGSALWELSNLLLPEDRSSVAGKARWMIVADSGVAGVPFAALNVAADGYDPVISRREVTLVPTLREALRSANFPDTRRSVDLRRVAIFSDPVFTPLDSRVRRVSTRGRIPIVAPIARLAGTAREAQAIASQLAAESVLQFSGFEATRAAALSREAAEASVLHFATHAIASDAWPHGSGLLLTGTTHEGVALNGYVSTLDLLSRTGATDLVVLSACDTARGEASGAENVAGIARAFLAAGARRVIASRWPVDDAATAALMSRLYAGLAAGMPAARALRAAQAAMAGEEATRDPAFWAGFMLYESDPARLQSSVP